MALLSGSLYLRLPRDDSDAVFTAFKLLVADERSDVDRNFDAAILPCFHSKQLERETMEVPDLTEESHNAWMWEREGSISSENRSHCLRDLGKISDRKVIQQLQEQ